VTVAQALRLKLAHRRAEGFDFDESWADCVTGALRAAPPHERGDWRAVLEGTRSEWQAAYEGAEASALADSMSYIAREAEDDIEPACAHCGGDAPAGRRYCSDRCREGAKAERARERADELAGVRPGAVAA
jgi:hypothetical protein